MTYWTERSLSQSDLIVLFLGSTTFWIDVWFNFVSVSALYNNLQQGCNFGWIVAEFNGEVIFLWLNHWNLLCKETKNTLGDIYCVGVPQLQ